MINLDSFSQIYLYRPPVDFRRGINGLCALVQDQMNLDLFQKYLFIFTNSKRNKLKALYWDKTGFAMWVKNLIEDKYRWPLNYENNVIEVDVDKLNKFLIGLDPFKLPFKEKKYSKV